MPIARTADEITQPWLMTSAQYVAARGNVVPQSLDLAQVDTMSIGAREQYFEIMAARWYSVLYATLQYRARVVDAFVQGDIDLTSTMSLSARFALHVHCEEVRRIHAAHAANKITSVEQLTVDQRVWLIALRQYATFKGRAAHGAARVELDAPIVTGCATSATFAPHRLQHLSDADVAARVSTSTALLECAR